MSVSLLGPVTATSAIRGTLDLGSRLQRGVLALLALEVGTVVTTARVIEGLWGADPPPTAAATLRAYVSRLRAALGTEPLPRVSGGYALRLPVDAVDAAAHGALLAAAHAAMPTDPVEAAGLVGRAEQLWRGDPLADVAAIPFAAAAIADLRRQRREVVLLGLRLSLATGEAVSASGLLEAAVKEDPDDERAAALLLVALYRQGRQADALQRFTRIREHLVESLGVEPGPSLQRIRQMILSHDPRLLRGDPLVTDVTTAAPAQAAAVAVAPVANESAPRRRNSGNLPNPLTSFVGRAPQLAAVAELLGRGRLTTLTGVGGVGKTRLAIEAAHRCADDADDGPWLIELAALEDDTLLDAAVAQTLGIACGGETAIDAILAAMRERRALLVIDNCEHVITSAARLVERVLAACPDVRVLATSREPLGLLGEQILVVPALSTTGDVQDAVALFADRAALVDPTFTLDERTRPAVERICAALDGIPLAIELAAGRLSALTVAQIEGLLEDRFALLGHGPRTAQPRHRTLAATIAWSYDPLEEDLREALHAAAVFAGGFTLEALADVAQRPVGTTASLLTTLVEKSLVSTVDSWSGRRFRVLETIRRYCQEQMGRARHAALLDRHAAWAATFAEGVSARHASTDAPWSAANVERDNLRAALRHCRTVGDGATMVRLAGNLAWTWFRMSQAKEGVAWLDAALALADDDVDPAALAQAHTGRALLSYLVADPTGALDHLELAIVAAARADDPVRLSLAEAYLAYFQQAFGNVAVCDDLLQRADSREVPEWVRAEIDMVRGQIRRSQGLMAEAYAALWAARDRAEREDHSYVWGSSGWILAKMMIDEGQAEEAGTLLAEVVHRFAEQGDRSSLLTGVHTMASVAAKLGRLYEGAVLLGAVDARRGGMGFHPAQMDPIDGPRQRALVTDALPLHLLEQAMAEGAALDVRQMVTLAVSVGTAGSRDGPPRQRRPVGAARSPGVARASAV